MLVLGRISRRRSRDTGKESGIGGKLWFRRKQTAWEVQGERRLQFHGWWSECSDTLWGLHDTEQGSRNRAPCTVPRTAGPVYLATASGSLMAPRQPWDIQKPEAGSMRLGHFPSLPGWPNSACPSFSTQGLLCMISSKGQPSAPDAGGQGQGHGLGIGCWLSPHAAADPVCGSSAGLHRLLQGCGGRLDHLTPIQPLSCFT